MTTEEDTHFTLQALVVINTGDVDTRNYPALRAACDMRELMGPRNLHIQAADIFHMRADKIALRRPTCPWCLLLWKDP